MAELINSGIQLMLVGMGIVFLFLTMLVLAIHLMSGLVLRYFPDAPVIARVKSDAADTTRTIAAISAAVHQYRTTHKSE